MSTAKKVSDTLSEANSRGAYDAAFKDYFEKADFLDRNLPPRVAVPQSAPMIGPDPNLRITYPPLPGHYEYKL